MVKLDAVRSANTALVKSQPLVAVFVGATSGIGEYTYKALARAHGTEGKGLRAYLVGRTQKAADETIKECQSVCPDGEFIFVRAEDLSLLQDVDRVAAEIMKTEREKSTAKGQTAKIDILVMSQAYLKFEGRQETKEGLEANMSLIYYGRMRFAMNFLPLLLGSTLPAHIVSVYAAGMEANLFSDDLALRDPKHYSFGNSRSHCNYMKTLFMQKLIQEHPGKLSFVHVYPGLVLSKGFYRDTGFWFKLIWKWVGEPIAKLGLATPEQEAGDRVLYLTSNRFSPQEHPGSPAKTSENASGVQIATGTDGKVGSGHYAVGISGETISVQKAYAKYDGQDLTGRVWDHTMKAFEEIEAGKVFKA